MVYKAGFRARELMTSRELQKTISQWDIRRVPGEGPDHSLLRREIRELLDYIAIELAREYIDLLGVKETLSE